METDPTEGRVVFSIFFSCTIKEIWSLDEALSENWGMIVVVDKDERLVEEEGL